jgi:hypothetical protein
VADFIHAVRWRDAWHRKPSWLDILYRDPRPNGGLLRAFSNPRKAERYRLWAERKRRLAAPKINPFWLCHDTIALLTRFDQPILFDWILDCGLTPPELPKGGALLNAWFRWWGQVVAPADSEARRKIWEAFDRVDFYEVIAVPTAEVSASRGRQKAYMVLRIDWEYNEGQHLPAQAKLVKAFHARETAQADVNALPKRANPNAWENPFPYYLRRSGRPFGELELEVLAILDECGLPHPPSPTHLVASGHDWSNSDWWRRCCEQSARLGRIESDEWRRYYRIYTFDAMDEYEVVETFLD